MTNAKCSFIQELPVSSPAVGEFAGLNILARIRF
jgi:hypothetical protein